MHIYVHRLFSNNLEVNEIKNLTIANVTTMSSLEISKLTSKEHKNVLVDIRNMLKELDIDSAGFSAQYKDSTGRPLPSFNLDKDLTLTLVSGYSVKARYEIAKYWNAQEKPLSPAEQLLATAQFMVKQEKINAQIPLLQNEVKKISEKMDHNNHIFHQGEYTSIKAYGNVHKLGLDTKLSAVLGRACTKACGVQGIGVKKLPCPHFGEVNSYPVWIIEEALVLNGII